MDTFTLFAGVLDARVLLDENPRRNARELFGSLFAEGLHRLAAHGARALICSQRVSAAFPDQTLDAVARTVEENEEMSGERILADDGTRHLDQAVERAAHVGGFRGNEDAHRARV